MAAIGLTWEDTKKRLPPSVVAACHNAHDSVTISGVTEEVEKFVEELKKEEVKRVKLHSKTTFVQVFAKRVESAGVPFHSPVMMKVHPIMLAAFKTVIDDPRERSHKWVL